MRAGVPLDLEQSQPSTSYPEFHPHITIASFPSSRNIPLSTIRKAVPESQGPITVEFESIAIGDNFFRSVYLAVKCTAPLLDLHEHAHAALGLEARPGLAFPHISLCYIDENDAQNGARKRFLGRLEDGGRIKREDGRMGLDGGHESGWVWEFEATEVWIAQCDGPVSGWSVLAKIPLSR